VVQVYAVGRIVQRRKILGYKLLNIKDYYVKDYSIDKIKSLLKSGNTIGNLYLDKESDEVCEYYCSKTLSEYTQNGKRLGSGKDIFLTICVEASTASGKYHTNEVYYSEDGLLRVMDILSLNYTQHYDVINLEECIPFLNKEPVDMYVKNFHTYYSKMNNEHGDEVGKHLYLSNMGFLRYKISKSIEDLSIDFCRALELLDVSNNATITNMYISDKCESILPGAIHDLDLENLKIDCVDVCSSAFQNCNIKVVDIKGVDRDTKSDLFTHCNIEHLILPDWYDSWEILKSFDNSIHILEMTNTSCTKSVWEISLQDKKLLKKLVDILVLPSDFDFEQESVLRDELGSDVQITRRVQ
jgi:hypothetical protein